MPNNVTNEIKFYGQPEDIKTVRSLIKGSKDDLPMIDFDRLIPMPEPILRKLAEICNEHNVRFDGQWINEDWRSDSGSFESNDDVLYVYPDETEEQARERCKDLLNWDPIEDEN